MTKAISLLSGGLDSILATRLMLDQGMEVEALNFTTVCSGRDHGSQSAKVAADLLGINPSTLRNRMNRLGIEYRKGRRS